MPTSLGTVSLALTTERTKVVAAEAELRVQLATEELGEHQANVGLLPTIGVQTEVLLVFETVVVVALVLLEKVRIK